MEEIGSLIKKLYSKDKLALSRLITYVEDHVEHGPKIRKLLKEYAASLRIKPKKSYTIGITGSPGCGKSTLIDKIIKEYRRRGKTVGVILTDPTDPETGGAFLGDRIRMQHHTPDKGVFIRSMATRGCEGGLSWATRYAADLMKAYGFDRILVETIGVGQTGRDIDKVADIVIVVYSPFFGDDIQLLKTSPIKIADILVLNKSDLPYAEIAMMQIEDFLQYELDEKMRKLPVIKTVATRGEGVKELVDKIERLIGQIKTSQDK